MKSLTKIASASALAVLLTFSSFTLFAAGSHDHSHGHEMDFDPVENEFGEYQPKMKASRTIEVGMSDEMRFTPDVIRVKKGDVIKFKHTNNGKIMHEFVLGTPDSLDEHAEMMKKFPGMEHDEPYMAHVAPGKSATIMWKFSKEGEFAFGCLIPGHYDAGMKGKVIVES
ncbi:MAG: cupredoxin family protein [Granulosicoccus sp.]|nr:cupredoxin family protein [Granulosicoccus sp.]